VRAPRNAKVRGLSIGPIVGGVEWRHPLSVRNVNKRTALRGVVRYAEGSRVLLLAVKAGNVNVTL
jgi:hypothetical protein